MNTKVDTSVEAVEAAWEEYEISAKPCGNDGDMEFFHVDSMTDEAYNLYTIAKALVAERDALQELFKTTRNDAYQSLVDEVLSILKETK